MAQQSAHFALYTVNNTSVGISGDGIPGPDTVVSQNSLPDLINLLNQVPALGTKAWVNSGVFGAQCDGVNANVQYVPGVGTLLSVYQPWASELSSLLSAYVPEMPSKPFDAAVAALIPDTGTATGAAIAEALDAALDSPALTGTPTAPTPAVGDSSSAVANTAFVQNTVTEAASAASLVPVYVETRTTGLVVKSPNNLRTGLPPTTYPDGGYSTEMVIGVTGAAGSAVLTAVSAADQALVAGLGSSPFAAALNAADKSTDFFVEVVSNDATSTMTLRKPLSANFTGTLSAKYDAALGQHLTLAATRAYAQHIAAATGVLGGRGRILAGEWELRPATYNDVWALNAALVAYGVVNSPSPVVQTSLTVQSTHNVIHAVDFIEMYPTSAASGVAVGTHKQGHGADGTVYTGRQNSVLEFYTCAYRSTTTSSAGYLVRVVVTGDGATILDQTVDGWMNRFLIPVSGFDKIVVSVTNNNPADTPYYLALSNLTIREAGTSGLVGRGKIITFGDSWFARYAAEFSKALAEKVPATIVDHSLSGMTTQWALAWFDQYVLAEKPDECWFHFFTNDDNQVSGNFTAPDGSSQPLWPSGLTNTQSMVLWRQNILTLIYRCQKAGIRPVIVMPGGTASEAQTQRHCLWASNLDIPALVMPWPTTSTELADATAYVNTVGKRVGAQAIVSGAPKYASGPKPSDAWA